MITMPAMSVLRRGLLRNPVTRRSVITALAALLLVVSGPLNAQILGSSPGWPQFHGSPLSAGVALRDTDLIVGEPEWVVDIDSQLISSPVVDNDGNLYIAQRDGHITSLAPDGSQRWRINYGAPISAPPALAGSRLYFIRHFEADEDSPYPFRSSLAAASTTNGDFAWQFELPDDSFTLSAPKVWNGPEGRVAIFVYANRRTAGGPAGELFVLDSVGNLRARSSLLECPWPLEADTPVWDAIVSAASFVWKSLTFQVEFDTSGLPDPLGRPFDSTPTLLDSSNMVDSGVLVGIADNLCNIGVFYYDDGELTERWKVRHKLGQIHGSPMMIPAGMMVIGNEAGKVSAFGPASGNLLWEYDAGEPVLTTPASFSNPIYVVGEQHLHVLSWGGDRMEKIRLILTDNRVASPVASNNWLHIAQTNDLLSLDRTNLQRRAHQQSYSLGYFEPAPAIGPEGQLYVIHKNSQIWAFAAPEQ